MRITMLALAAVFCSPVHAQNVQSHLPKGQELETQASGDLTGDGIADAVIIGRNDDSRALKLLRGAKGRFEVAGTLTLEPYPLGPASLKIAKGVLTVEDLTGGTTAYNSKYIYRWDAKVRRMRLIGLDVTLYSRTYAHDGSEMSWNLLTGDLITREMKLSGSGASGDAAYDPSPERKVKRPSPPLYMETTPTPEDALSAASGT